MVKKIILSIAIVLGAASVTLVSLTVINPEENRDDRVLKTSDSEDTTNSSSLGEEVASDGGALLVSEWGVKIQFWGEHTKDVTLLEPGLITSGRVESVTISTQKMSMMEAAFMPEGYAMGVGAIMRSKDKQLLQREIGDAHDVVQGEDQYFYAMVLGDDFIQLTRADSSDGLSPITKDQLSEMVQIGEDLADFNKNGSVVSL